MKWLVDVWNTLSGEFKALMALALGALLLQDLAMSNEDMAIVTSGQAIGSALEKQLEAAP